MPSLTEWRVPPANQPRASDYAFDLDRTLLSVVGLHSIIPPDAFSAETLGTERAGNGVVIDNGLVLSIGYLIVLFGGFFFFNEPLNLAKCAGVALICAGVVLISGA